MTVPKLVPLLTLKFETAAPPPKTMTREYQEQSNEYAKSQNINPIVSFALVCRCLTFLQFISVSLVLSQTSNKPFPLAPSKKNPLTPLPSPQPHLPLCSPVSRPRTTKAKEWSLSLDTDRIRSNAFQSNPSISLRLPSSPTLNFVPHNAQEF